MLKGILRPRPDSADPWTLPAAMASRGALLGEVKSLYPNRVIWVDYSAETAGDGSYSRPFQSLDVVFGDDTLECVCQHLCADKITVRVKGPVDVSAGAMDGNNRHYARHLVIRPWNDGERLEVRRIVFSDTREEGPLTASMRIGGDMVYNLHGVKWLDTDFKYILCQYLPEGLTLPSRFSTLDVPAATWAIFDAPECEVQGVWRRIWSEWFPSSEYETAEGPQFEMYYGLGKHQNGFGEIWVPVRKK